MRPLKSLTLEAIVDLLATTFGAVEDSRAPAQLSYPLHDTLMSGFAVMFFQPPSLLPFQRAMEQKRRRCNLQTIFGVREIPSDTQRQEILDGVEPESLRGVFPQLWEKVRRAGGGGRFTTTLPSGRHQGTYYTVALDGSEYFRSTKVQCPHCLRQPDAKGRVHYSPMIVGATVVQAGSHQVVPLDVEEVRNGTVESGGDAYILSRVIHDWDDDHAVTILKNCHRAMTDQGKLILIERVLPARVESSSAVQALVLSDLNMMVMNGGRERTEAEYRSLFEAASFRLTKVTPTQSAMSVIEGARA